MVRVFRIYTNLLLARRGVTALEYGMIAAVIGGIVVTAATGFGTSLTSAYGTIGAKIVSKASGM